MILVSSVEIRFLLIVVQSTVKNDSRYSKLFHWFLHRIGLSGDNEANHSCVSYPDELIIDYQTTVSLNTHCFD